jgi:hypothetical protein
MERLYVRMLGWSRLGSCRIIVRNCLWWVHQDSNLGPAGYEPVALTAELWTRSERAILTDGANGERFAASGEPDVRFSCSPQPARRSLAYCLST